MKEKKVKVILYVHGGGWLAANSTVLTAPVETGHVTTCSSMARDCFKVSYAAMNAGSGVRFRWRISTAWFKAANSELYSWRFTPRTDRRIC